MIKKNRVHFLLLTIIVLHLTVITSCKKNDNTETPTIKLPEVTTTVVGKVLESSATCEGYIPVGGEIITERGFCWSTQETPTLEDNSTTSGAGSSFFSSEIKGLIVNTKYYFRAYATNKGGTSYGNILSFTTQPPVTDIDGNLYHTTTIGTQVWMAENLKVTKYRNGDPIPSLLWEYNLKSGAYCTSNATYGNLYNWYAINDSRNVAPIGWHVATIEEWTTLINYLGGKSIAGNKLISQSWHNNLTDNSSGFWALPGGEYFPKYSSYGYGGEFYDQGDRGFWWTSTSQSVDDAWSCILNNFGPDPDIVSYMDKSWGSSIRCIRDN